jgi:hypothetical protein
MIRRTKEIISSLFDRSNNRFSNEHKIPHNFYKKKYETENKMIRRTKELISSLFDRSNNRFSNEHKTPIENKICTYCKGSGYIVFYTYNYDWVEIKCYYCTKGCSMHILKKH